MGETEKQGETEKAVHRVLVLGAYGLIGSAVARRLLAEGHQVVGLGRNQRAAQSVLPQVDWIIQDLADLCSPENWSHIVQDIDFVVNCAGALQDGYRDDLEAVHHRAIAALVEACEEANVGIIQISAVGAKDDATTDFLRTKARGDAIVRAARVPFWIFRPGMVISQTAFGGSAALRMLAAFPIIQPLAHADAQIQTVASADVAGAVAMAINGKIPQGMECDLVEQAPHTLRDIILKHRAWLGFSSPSAVVHLPNWTMAVTSKVADMLGSLGWRSPLRTTGVRVLEDGVTGNPTAWNKATGQHVAALDETLARLPSSIEYRQAARMSLLMPLVFGVLFLFWLASGVIGFLQTDVAAQVLRDIGWSDSWSKTSVLFWSVVDIAIAFGLLVRRFAAWSCWAMVAVSLIYLGSATLLVPNLWLDPLGPLVKVIPGLALALVARALLDSR